MRHTALSLENQLPVFNGFLRHFLIEGFSNICRENSSFINLTRMTGTVYKGQYTFMIISRSIRLRMRNVQTKVVGKIKTNFIFNNSFLEDRAVYEIMWMQTTDPDRPQMTIWCMRIACWITTATNTHSENVRLIAFLRQQW